LFTNKSYGLGFVLPTVLEAEKRRMEGGKWDRLAWLNLGGSVKLHPELQGACVENYSHPCLGIAMR
jgi:hypothetical protein